MIHSFLLIGQSNMAGREYIDEAINVDVSHIKVLRNGRWQEMFRPINPDRSFSGVNLAESFAEQYAKKYAVDVGLICCADGGTSLEQWKKGGLLFENAVSQAKLAKKHLPLLEFFGIRVRQIVMRLYILHIKSNLKSLWMIYAMN